MGKVEDYFKVLKKENELRTKNCLYFIIIFENGSGKQLIFN